MSQGVHYYHSIIEHYERCLAVHGDNHRGVDWPRAEDADQRYAVMLGVIAMSSPRPIRLLDFGCGTGHLLDYISAMRSRESSTKGWIFHIDSCRYAATNSQMCRSPSRTCLKMESSCPNLITLS